MADLIFNRKTNSLTWTKKGLSWDAVSGPFGNGVLPIGSYKISRREITGYSAAIDSAYQDETGKGFFVPIYPNFETNRGKTGGRLGIHPDGNNPGTLGCIGISGANAKDFHDAISQTSPSVNLTLEVK